MTSSVDQRPVPKTDFEAIQPFTENYYKAIGKGQGKLTALGAQLLNLKSTKEGVEIFSLMPVDFQAIFMKGALTSIKAKKFDDTKLDRCWKIVKPYLKNDETSAQVITAYPPLMWRRYVKWDAEQKKLALTAPSINNEQLALLLKEIPSEWKQEATSLTLSHGEALKTLEGLEELTLLKHLTINECLFINSLKGISSLSHLETFSLKECASLETLKGIEDLKELKSVTLNECILLKFISALKGQSLETLEITGCYNLRHINMLADPEEQDKVMLSSLKKLTISGSPMVKCSLNFIDAMPHLTELNVSQSNNIDIMKLYQVSSDQLPPLQVSVSTVQVDKVNGISNMFEKSKRLTAMVIQD